VAAKRPNDVYLTPGEAWALVAAQPLAQLSNMALLPSLGAMRADLALSYSELGIVVAAFGFARLLVDIPAGGLARRWNPRTVLLAAFATSTLGSTLGIFATNGWQLAAVRFVIGVASSVAQAMILAWLVGGAGRAGRGRVMANSEAFFSIVGLVVPPLSGILAGPIGWRAAYLIGAVAAAIGGLAVLAFTRPAGAARSVGLDSGQPASGSFLSSWLELRTGGAVLVAAYVATFVIFFYRNGVLNSVVPLLGTDLLGIEPFQIGLLVSAINLLTIGTVLIGGRAADRFGRFAVLTPYLAALLACQVLLLFVHDPLTYVVVGLAQALCFFANALPPVILGDVLSARARPQGIAVYRAVSDIALLIGPSLMGAALQLGGFPAAELASIAVAALAFATVAAIALRRRAPDP
jgi:MFS transporter, DHA1 family, multidrug resistance protein